MPDPDERRRLAFIGLGNMGLGMASRLAEEGWDLAVFNRTRSKSEEVGALGARVADSPADAAAGADVVMLSLADQNVVRAMLLGEDGAMAALAPGSYIVDMSTVPPAFARELAETAAQAGHQAVDACVYGAPAHARSGELRVMVGAPPEAFQSIEPILRSIGQEVTHLGPNGMGATMKLVLNMLMGVQMPALAEAVIFGEQAGLPREAILKMIAGSGYSSPVMTFRCGFIERRSFGHAAFKLALMHKDMELALAESAELGVPMPVTESACESLAAADAEGLGHLDVAAIVAHMERLVGMDRYPWPLDADADIGGPPPEVPGGPPGRPG